MAGRWIIISAPATGRYWFEGQTALLWIWGAMLVLLTGIYAWATVAFGLRFSNLTHRGILTHGPYAWTKHPAYLSKNAYWWLATMPFLVTTGSTADMIRNTAILALGQRHLLLAREDRGKAPDGRSRLC